MTNLKTLTIAHNELEGELPKELTDSKMWKNIVNKTDLTQDGGKVIVDTSSEGVTVTGGNPGNIN